MSTTLRDLARHPWARGLARCLTACSVSVLTSGGSGPRTTAYAADGRCCRGD